MINIDINNLNPLEKEIYNTLTQKVLTVPNIRITQAAEYCECSISKISKVVKKLGFRNYKQFMGFLYGEEISISSESSELKRLRRFIDDFDPKVVDDFIKLLNQHERVILFGYGPSYIVAQYLEYKLHTITNKFAFAMQDVLSVTNMADDKSLLVIFTATGSFKSFEDIYKNAKAKGCTVLVVSEEYNPSLVNACDNLFWLSKFNQSSDLKPHEKSRTIFFIFIEEVIRKLMLT